ncbi:MAG: alanine--tRNA ligase [Parcubacteria group bacterium]|nr:alanine--tRNA ligase [Parcubacteria group bacterium]
MTIHEIRTSFLNYFQKQAHVVIPSASLVPDNDPTTLFTGSGMQPMVPFLLGETHPLGVRVADSQKCFRSQDIDEVGDNRHTTFFEMLGNWSLGDYFKKEQLPWVFEWLTKEIGLNPKNLYVTVYRGNDDVSRDEESVGLWQKIFSDVDIDAVVIDNSEKDGLQNGRIFYYDDSKNWWSRFGSQEKMPQGEPGGPDSEMFWDFGESLKLHDASKFRTEPCHVNCDCGRFLEIGNNVFMEFIKTESGFEFLPKKNVDFGGGLLRIAAAAANDPDVFNTHIFSGMKTVLESLSGKDYVGNTHAYRVILDHLRAAVFLIGDGVIPSNKDRGYFSRRLIRRTVRFGRNLGITESFCGKVGEQVIKEYCDVYRNLLDKRVLILEELTREEEKFVRTLEKGEKEFVKMFSASKSISGENAFVLYSTYGFPIELTEEMAVEQGQIVDREKFTQEFKKHQDLSRSGSTQKFAGGLADHSDATVQLHTATHMLHKALRTVLGTHVEQRGSNITPKRLRFDFSYGEKLTDEQKQQVEDLVNTNINKDLNVHYEILSLEEAKKMGAIGLFEDKYAQIEGKIKVYFIGGEAAEESFSREVCGGPHVNQTSELGHFKITKEESCASGIRRIKAILD